MPKCSNTTVTKKEKGKWLSLDKKSQMHIHNHRTKMFIKTLQYGSLAQPLTLYPISKLSLYTQNNLPLTETCFDRCIQGFTSSPSPVRPCLHSFIKRDLKLVWVLHKTLWQSGLGMTACFLGRRFHVLHLQGETRFQLPSLVSLTTFIGIGTSPDIHQFPWATLLACWVNHGAFFCS